MVRVLPSASPCTRLPERKTRAGNTAGYNYFHLHSSLDFVTPQSVHEGLHPTGYVIIHKLSKGHLVHRNHTQRFIELQAKVMPDWEKWKSRLERVLA